MLFGNKNFHGFECNVNIERIIKDDDLVTHLVRLKSNLSNCDIKGEFENA